MPLDLFVITIILYFTLGGDSVFFLISFFLTLTITFRNVKMDTVATPVVKQEPCSLHKWVCKQDDLVCEVCGKKPGMK